MAEGAFGSQLALLVQRFGTQLVRNPIVWFPNLLITIFFLFVYDGGLGGSFAINTVTGGNFLNFILPVVILFASLAGGSAGFWLVQDVESGYFRRLLAMPVSRTALVLAPMIVGAIQVVIQSVVVFAIGWGLGADPATGVGGVVVVLLLALFWGLGFAGFSVAVGLHTGNAQAAQSATLIFFPLIFLSPIFLPEDQLKDWMQAVSTVNPTTYALQGMRSLLIEGWNAEDIGAAVAAIGGFVALTLGFAVLVARRATRRG